LSANRFAVCTLASRATRRLHKPGERRVEESLKQYIEEAEKYLTSGTDEEVDLKNFRGGHAVVWFND